MNNRRKYDKEFKINAVKLYEESGKTLGEIEDELGITRGNLHRWRKDLKIGTENAFPGNGKISAKDQELMKLKREYRIVKEERDILKKAIGIFSAAQK